jgi:hypothetical protein
LARECEDQSKNAHVQAEIMARQNIMAAMQPPAMPSIPPSTNDGSKSHEEMASIFVAAAQAHLMEADRQKMRAAVVPPMGLMQQNAFAGAWQQPPMQPRMPMMQQPMYDQSMYHPQMPYPMQPQMGYENPVPDHMDPALAALAPSKMPKPPSHHSLKGLGSSANLKGLKGVGSTASLRGLEKAASIKGLGGSTASLKALERLGSHAFDVDSPSASSRPMGTPYGSSRKGKGAGVSFNPGLLDEAEEDLWLHLRRNYVTKNTFIEVPDYEAIEKETLKRVNMSAPTNLFAWKGGLGASLGGLLETDSQFSDDRSNADHNPDIRFDF